MVGGNEVVDRLTQLLGTGETGGGEGLAAEEAEPDLHLIEPGGVGGDVMDVHVAMSLPPAVMFGRMGVEIIEDDMDLPAGIGGHDAVHKIEELHPAATPVMAGLDQSRGLLQSGKQGGRAMPLIVMGEPMEGPAIGQPQPALGAFQGLDVRLLVDRQHDGVLRRIQIEAHDIGGLLGKAGSGAHPPATATLEADAVLAQHAPDLIVRDVGQGGGQQSAVPAGIAGGRSLVQLLQNAPFGGSIVGRRLAAAPGIVESSQPPRQKPVAPLAHGGGAGTVRCGNRLIAQAIGGIEEDLRSEHIPASAGRTAYDGLQVFSLGVAQYRCLCSHTGHYTPYANYCN